MKFENTSVYNFEGAIRGMRNPMNSWDKSDSVLNAGFGSDNVIIGKNDLKLAQKLIIAGSEHRKFMRQIFVSVDITAPLYWWKEFDTYKVGTVANSTSTMHKLAATPITLDCFEIDDYDPSLVYKEEPDGTQSIQVCSVEDSIEDGGDVDSIISFLEYLRLNYLKTKDKRYWKELIRWLPESWLQKRTVTMNYENLLAMCSKRQRRYHKLNEWSGIDNEKLPNFISWVRTLPYAEELIFVDEVEEKWRKIHNDNTCR